MFIRTLIYQNYIFCDAYSSCAIDTECDKCVDTEDTQTERQIKIEITLALGKKL